MKPKGQAARFGQYWTNGTWSWTGDKEHQLWFPYAAPPPRIGKEAPNRWAAKQPIETPPFAYRLAFMVAGWRPVSKAEKVEARELFRRRNTVHRVNKEPEPDLDNLRYSPPRQGLALEDYASGVCWLEARSGLVKRHGVWTQMGRPIAGEEWASRGYTVSSLPDGLMLSREERELLARILAKSPGRKRGRPLIGEQPLNALQRKRRERAKAKALLPRESTEPGAVSLPLGAVPGPNFIVKRNNMLLDRMNKMEAQQDAMWGFLERLARQFDEVIARLDKDPDRMITSEEFRILTAMGFLGHRMKSELH
jgi:hypothetical protein